MSDVIFVVGYYRSGTSGLSGALQKLGVDIQSEAAANEHNPLGYFEIPELIGYDVELMQRLGREWGDVGLLPEGWQDGPDMARFTARLDKILRRRFPASTAIWAVKHPHLCHLLPIYERAARQAGHQPHVIHIFREPAAAAASQKRKNGLSRAHALLLWLSYATAAEYNARHLRRSWLTYHEMLAAPEAAFRQLETDLGLPLTRLRPGGLTQATAHLTGELNRSTPLPRENLYRPLAALADRLWASICARDLRPALWDELRAQTADLAGFLGEIRDSRLRSLPGLGGPALPLAANANEAPASLRPGERLDEGARSRLTALAADQTLPRIAILIAAPAGRAAAIGETLETLNGQWRAPDLVRFVSVDPVSVEGIETVRVAEAPGALTIQLCAELNALAETHDYVAVLNAGDRLDPDACLRFALCAARTEADMIYCDEVVPGGNAPWVRYKPGWDVIRLAQSAYLGDWVWYRGEAVRRLGFDPAFAGAEEYEFQLRLSEGPHRVERLAEVLFVREAASRRDDIAVDEFAGRAAQAVAAHLARLGMPATVGRRQFVGLFRHERAAADPGTTLILLCDEIDVPTLNRRLTGLLEDGLAPVLLAATAPTPEVAEYMARIRAQADTLGASVGAVPPGDFALAAALALVPTPHVAILDARAEALTPDWLAVLRARLADARVCLVSARSLVPGPGPHAQPLLEGPVVIGAPIRLGHGYMPDSARMGGWLLVDQQAAALTPPALLGRTQALRACTPGALPGDAFWIDLCAQLRAQGGHLVWTPDASFLVPAASLRPDAASRFRTGGPAARALPWQDPFHHPALDLDADLLVTAPRPGLIASAPADPNAVLFTGAVGTAEAVLAAARAFRAAGLLEAGWAPDGQNAGPLGRRAPRTWVRVNPDTPAEPHSPPFAALFTAPPRPGAAEACAKAASLHATSPALAAQLAAIAPGAAIELWRPALRRSAWVDKELGTGLNTKPRVLWFDEGNTPDWFPGLINETLEDLHWIVVEQPGASYAGQVTRIPRQTDDTHWASDLCALAPHILLRPAGREAWGDGYFTLLAAAAGAHLIIDQRLDTPAGLPAERLGQAASLWKSRLLCAVRDLKGTLASGKQTRAAALALPSVEELPAPWAPAGFLEAAQ